MTYVVDASVVAKWFLPEEHKDKARTLRTEMPVSPDFLLVELANTFVKTYRRGMVPAEDVGLALGVTRAAVTLVETPSLVDDAVSLAIRFDRSVYDALYVALAVRDGHRLVTADRKLYNAVVPSLPDAMLWIEDVATSS